MNKEIEEMARLIYDNRPIKDIWNEDAEEIAKILYNAGYRQCKDKVALTKGAYESISSKAKANVANAIEIRRETAREIFDKVYDFGQGFFIERSLMEEDEFNGILDEVKKLFLNVVAKKFGVEIKE